MAKATVSLPPSVALPFRFVRFLPGVGAHHGVGIQVVGHDAGDPPGPEGQLLRRRGPHRGGRLNPRFSGALRPGRTCNLTTNHPKEGPTSYQNKGHVWVPGQ